MNRQALAVAANKAMDLAPESYWPSVVLELLDLLKDREKKLELATTRLGELARIPSKPQKRKMIRKRVQRSIKVNMPA